MYKICPSHNVCTNIFFSDLHFHLLTSTMRLPAERSLMILIIPPVKEFQWLDLREGLSLLLSHHLQHLTLRRKATSPTSGFPDFAN